VQVGWIQFGTRACWRSRFHFDFICIGHRHSPAFARLPPLGGAREGGRTPRVMTGVGRLGSESVKLGKVSGRFSGLDSCERG
jgi:hypothetical protein